MNVPTKQELWRAARSPTDINTLPTGPKPWQGRRAAQNNARSSEASTIASTLNRRRPIAIPAEALAHNRIKIIVTMNTCHDRSASHPVVRRQSCANLPPLAIGLSCPLAAPQYNCIHTGTRPLIILCRSASLGGARKPERIAGSVVPPRRRSHCRARDRWIE